MSVFLSSVLGNSICSIQDSHSFHGYCHAPRRKALRGPKCVGFRSLRNLLICKGIANRRSVLKSWCQHGAASRVVRWQFSGTQNDLCSARKIREALQEASRRRSDGNEWFDYAEPRAIPSLCILNCRVDRFIARCAAAPRGPATTQLHSLSAFRICWRSVSCKRA